MGPLEITVALAALLLVLVAAIALLRQGHPDDAADHERVDRRDSAGPAEADYPPGARPAGPGAEADHPDAIYGEDPDHRDADGEVGPP